MQNISKYVAINDFMLLEYEFNRDGTLVDLSSMGVTVVENYAGNLQLFNYFKSYALGVTNNVLELNSVPTDALRTRWMNNYENIQQYNSNFSSVTAINTTSYAHDTIKVHVVSGYNFDDVAGFMLQVRAEKSSGDLVDLSNFTYIKQPDALGSANVMKFASNILYLGNKFYDKYVEFKVPSVYALGANTPDTSMGSVLGVKNLSDVFLTYSTVATYQHDNTTKNNTFTLADTLNLQLPVTSVADNFNVFIAESTIGDFIEYYATWANEIIGGYMGDIESGRIALYTSSNPNDNYDFVDVYGSGSRKWVLMHEIYVYEQLPGITAGSSLLTQKFAFTQEDNFSSANYFRPVLKNADLDVSYTIQYVCRLSNRMDGTQIIRRASFASTDPKKYGLKFNRLNVDNIIPYKIFNRIDNEKANVIEGSSLSKTKYVKTFYDTTTVVLNQFNEVYPDGTGPLFLKNGNALYKLKFEKKNTANNDRQNVDLSGVFNYAMLFVLDDNTKMEIVPTYSSNMNTTIGELEFKISGDQSYKLLQQKNNAYSIIVKNPDNTDYVFYEGVYYDNKNYQVTMNSLKEITTIGELNNKIASMEIELKTVKDENAALKTT
jgi:hypothetical protein